MSCIQTHLGIGLTPAEGQESSAVVSLTPSESKRLIGKAIAVLPEIRQAWQKGTIIVSRGTTNAYVAEELLGIPVVSEITSFIAGCIVNGELSGNTATTVRRPYVVRDGKLVDMRISDALKEFTGEDVFIKGANAVDIWGNVGILSGGEGGTIAAAWPVIMPRGSHLVVPVGLEKLIPSVAEARKRCRIFRFKYSTGLPVSLMPVEATRVVTEIQAFKILANVTATHIASGGIGGSEGTVVMALDGNAEDIEKAFDIVKTIKGEPPVPGPISTPPAAAMFNYDPVALHEAIRIAPRPPS